MNIEVKRAIIDFKKTSIDYGYCMGKRAGSVKLRECLEAMNSCEKKLRAICAEHMDD